MALTQLKILRQILKLIVGETHVDQHVVLQLLPLEIFALVAQGLMHGAEMFGHFFLSTNAASLDSVLKWTPL